MKRTFDEKNRKNESVRPVVTKIYKEYTPDYKRIEKLLDKHIRLVIKYKKEVSKNKPSFIQMIGYITAVILPSLEDIYSELHKNYKLTKVCENNKLRMRKSFFNIID